MAEEIKNTFSEYLGPEFQQKLMWQLLVEPEFAEKVMNKLAIEYFDDDNMKRLFIIMLEYFKENGKPPNLQNKSIHQAVYTYKTPGSDVEEEVLLAVVDRIRIWNERVINKNIQNDGDVVQNETNMFIKQQEYRKLGEYILTKVRGGEIKNKNVVYDLEQKIQHINEIGNEEDFGTEVIEGIEHALRKEFRETIPTGIYAIDAVTGNGLGKGEFGLIIAPSGVGKTTLLTKIANTAYAQGKHVLQIVFEDTEEGVFAIRVADCLREKGPKTFLKPGDPAPRESLRGTGVYLSSNGDITAKQAWGKRARWMVLQGVKHGKVVGIAIYNHPESLNYPTYWHVRNYGLFSANPLGQGDFQRQDDYRKNPVIPLKLTLKKGEKVHFRFLVVAYEGAKTPQDFETQFKRFEKQ